MNSSEDKNAGKAHFVPQYFELREVGKTIKS